MELEMLSTAHAIKARLERKFFCKFSVTSKVVVNGKSGILIRWTGSPSSLEVSMTIRDFRETKHYFKRMSTINVYNMTTEEYKTPSQLRKA
jgi:hypothetical protein